MDEIDQSRIDGLDSRSSDSSEPLPRVSRLLLLWPLAGFIAVVAAMITYRPLDEILLWWVGAVPCGISYTLTNIVWRKAKSGDNVRSFFPTTSGWRSAACLFQPFCFSIVLLIVLPSSNIAKWSRARSLHTAAG